jgi:predicted glycosyltransferase
VNKKTIWIDLDNSPHVPFFKPIIDKLSIQGYSVVLTARDCAQTCDLADRNGFRYVRVGRHYGKNKLLKIYGLLVRSLQLVPFALKAKPFLAVSHGSRSQVVLASILGIPSVMIFDYEFIQLIKPTWVILPEVIPDGVVKFDNRRIFKYPGIKEDVYVPAFSPDPAILGDLGLDRDKLVITIRPPATEAHYHNGQSEVLFHEVIDYFGQMDDVQMVLLPRNKTQEDRIKSKWPEMFSKGRMIIPDHVIDGLNLIWFSDIVVSGGGTMNREAAALGVPVYSIFRGVIGAVDRFLAKNGKLILLETVADIRSKISLQKRNSHVFTERNANGALDTIVETLAGLMDGDRAGV